MPDLESLGIDRKTAEKMYAEWQGGVSKSELEHWHLGPPQSHGRLFSSLVRQELGIETERSSRLPEEILRLERENKMLRAEVSELRRRIEQAGGGNEARRP